MNQQLQTQVYYRGSRVGMPHKGTAIFYDDRIEVKRGNKLLTKIDLNTIEYAKLTATVVGLHFKGGGYASLDFQTLGRRIMYALIGRFGILVGSFSGPGRTQAEAWTASLRVHGIDAS